MNSSLDIDDLQTSSLTVGKKMYDLMLDNLSQIKKDKAFMVYGSLRDVEKCFEQGLPQLVSFFFAHLSEEAPNISVATKTQALLLSLDVLLCYSSLTEHLRQHPLLSPSCAQSLIDAKKTKERLEEKAAANKDYNDFFEAYEEDLTNQNQSNMCIEIIEAGGVCSLGPEQLFDCTFDIVKTQVLTYSQTLLSQFSQSSPPKLSRELFIEEKQPKEPKFALPKYSH